MAKKTQNVGFNTGIGGHDQIAGQELFLRLADIHIDPRRNPRKGPAVATTGTVKGSEGDEGEAGILRDMAMKAIRAKGTEPCAGQDTAVWVRRAPKDAGHGKPYELVSGYTRCGIIGKLASGEAAEDLKGYIGPDEWKTLLTSTPRVRAVVKEAETDIDVEEAAIAENVLRNALTPAEKIAAFSSLAEKHRKAGVKKSDAQYAVTFNCNASGITRYKNILEGLRHVKVKRGPEGKEKDVPFIDDLLMLENIPPLDDLLKVAKLESEEDRRKGYVALTTKVKPPSKQGKGWTDNAVEHVEAAGKYLGILEGLGIISVNEQALGAARHLAAILDPFYKIQGRELQHKDKARYSSLEEALEALSGKLERAYEARVRATERASDKAANGTAKPREKASKAGKTARA